MEAQIIFRSLSTDDIFFSTCQFNVRVVSLHHTRKCGALNYYFELTANIFVPKNYHSFIMRSLSTSSVTHETNLLYLISGF